MILYKYKWPKYLLQFKVIKGISYGVCKEDKRKLVVPAHAHSNPESPVHGWICFRSKTLSRNSLLMLHEIAHLLVKFKHGHNDVWRRVLLRIGGTLDPFPTTKGRETVPYHKKSRK